MASDKAIDLKKEWCNHLAEDFEPLTFGELKVGNFFISQPEPGDNSGHGGFRGVFLVFVKRNEKTAERVGCSENKISCQLPNSLLVTRVCIT